MVSAIQLMGINSMIPFILLIPEIIRKFHISTIFLIIYLYDFLSDSFSISWQLIVFFLVITITSLLKWFANQHTKLVDQLYVFNSTAAILHDISNPISLLTMNLDSLKKQYRSKKSKQLDSVRKIQVAVDRLESHVESLKLYDYVNQHPEYILIEKELEEIMNIFSSSKDLHINIFSTSQHTIRMSKVLFRRLIINFLMNSIHSLKDLVNKNIAISIDEEQMGIRIVIKDNGLGIESKKIKYGLGLTICKEILRLYNSYFTIKSDLNLGTEVEIHLHQ